MTEKLINVIKNGEYKVSSILLINYKSLNLTEMELIVLIYILNNSLEFNPKKIADNFSIPLASVLEIIDSLQTKDFLEIKIINNHNVREEVIDVTNYYKKIAYFIVKDEEPKKEVKSNIYDIFEQEFSRTLSPIEYELINGWVHDNFNEDIILLALKEAVYNGAFNLRYIDKILYEWKKKGINTKDDYDRDKEEFNARKSKPKKDFLDYDWLNDTDE